MTGLLALLLVAVLIVIPAVVMRWTNAAHRRARSHHRALDALGHITSSAPAGRVETTRTTVPFGSTAPPGGKADLDGNPRLATDHLGSQAYVRVVSSDSPAPLPAPRPLTGGWRPTRATGAAPFRRPGVVPDTAGFEQPEVLPGQLSGRDGVEHVRAFRDGEDPSVEGRDPDEADLEEVGAEPAQAASLEGPAVRVLHPEGPSGDDDAAEAATGPVPAVGEDAEADDRELEEEEDDWPIEPAATAEVRILDTGAAPLDPPAWELPQPEQDEPQPAPAVPMSRLVIPAFPEEDPTLEHVVVLGAPPNAPATSAGPPAPGAVAAESGPAPLTVTLPDTSDSPAGNGAGTGNGAGNGAGEPPTHPLPLVSEVEPARAELPTAEPLTAEPPTVGRSTAEPDDTGAGPEPGTPLVTTTTAATAAATSRPIPAAGAHTARPGTGPSHRRPRTPGRHRARNLATAAVILVLVAAAALVANRELLNRHPTASPPSPRTPPASSVPVPNAVHHHHHHHQASSSSPGSTTAPPTTARPPVTLVSNSPGITIYRVVGPAQITLTATGPCWVDVRRPDANGGDVFVQTMAAGQSHTVQGPLWLRLGNPTAVTIKVGGITVHPPVKQGSPYDVQFR